nr:cobalamin biosynthesis protein CbiX [Myxococcota bacterium]
MPHRSAWIVIDHGSRQAQANALVVELARQIQLRRPGTIVTHAHMEIASPALDEAVVSCMDRGAEEILVLPYFLSPGRHTQETIPDQVA